MKHALLSIALSVLWTLAGAAEPATQRPAGIGRLG